MEQQSLAPLRLHARPGSGLDEFNVYYLAFKNHHGLVKVKLNDQEMKMPAAYHRAIAEMRALEYLLAGIEVLSQGRKGDSVLITVSTRQVKEVMLLHKLSKPMRDRLLSEARNLKYIKGTNLPLVCYRLMAGLMPSVIARFINAQLFISDDVKWINPVVPDKNKHELDDDRKIMHRLVTDRLGSIAVTTHAFQRFVQRSKSNSPETHWDYFVETLRQPTLQQTETPEDIAEYHIKKYGKLARHYYDSKTRWHFVIVDEDGEQVLVTSFIREVNLNDYTKR